MSSGREVLFEFQRVGNAVKVCALDVQTQVEISIVGDSRAPQAHLKAVALRKLLYVLARQPLRK
jgi:hypothetical protein